jgi:hypothetical protein
LSGPIQTHIWLDGVKMVRIRCDCYTHNQTHTQPKKSAPLHERLLILVNEKSETQVVRVYRYMAEDLVNAIPKRYLHRNTENQPKNRSLLHERLVTND